MYLLQLSPKMYLLVYNELKFVYKLIYDRVTNAERCISPVSFHVTSLSSRELRVLKLDYIHKKKTKELLKSM